MSVYALVSWECFDGYGTGQRRLAFLFVLGFLASRCIMLVLDVDQLSQSRNLRLFSRIRRRHFQASLLSGPSRLGNALRTAADGPRASVH